ncbi:hypothetical protein [uncultured Bifidobacterium sp.]|uniref:hypothetical protein n=1 Tax=uncultured Bifidobacterium sp. TaxID=165187 RepID=UPI002582AC03|nr:hypothetical protein [uncultured Bifidobacterium sp.]
MSRTLYARLVAYRAFGARLGVLPEPVSFDASIIHNDAGALTVEYSALSAGASLLDRQLTDGLEIALEVSDGTGYVEPDNARFVITGRSGKTDDRTGTVKYTGQCIQWLLSKAKMLDTKHLLADGDNKGKRPFYSANPGTILKTLMDENAARGGVAAGLTLGFDTAKDAGGDGWAKKYTLYYSLGVDLQSALSSLVQGGGCDWRTSKRRLDVYNADSGKLSRDLSKSVILQLGRDISEAPYEESISTLASTILVEGDNSLVFTMANPAAPHPWGKWEEFVSQGGVSDKATATAFMQTKLADAARVRGQYTRTVLTAGDITHLPLIDYHPGDWITAPTVSHAEKTRVQEIDVSMRQGDGLTASLALNDVKYDASVRQSKRMQGITGGASLAGSQGGKAASEHDHRVASAPAGLTATTTVYLDSTGHARGLVTVQWAAVTTATDGTALETSGYTVEWRKHVDGAPWCAAGTTDKLTLGIGNLDCGTQVEIRVRANATYSDKPGAWCTPVVVTVENDVTPCSVPSKPVLSSALGVVTIHWDGKTDAGASMEPDFDHVEVGRGTTANDLTQIAATQSGQGDYLDTARYPGTTWAYALRSVDHTGNRSAWSTLSTVTVASTVSHEEIVRIDSTLTQARKDIQSNTQTIADTGKSLAQTKSTLTQAQKDISDAKQAAADAYIEAHAKTHTYRGPDKPEHPNTGDLWLRTQAFFTRWEGERDNSPSDLADFCTVWEGERDNSPSDLIPLSDIIVETLIWDGTAWSTLGYADVQDNTRQIEQAKSDILANAAQTSDARRIAENASAAASNAQSTASTAQSVADAAKTAAADAVKRAQSASTAANTASTTASAAANTASSASSAASTAVSTAQQAKTTADAASTAASAARSTAQDAQTVANAASKAAASAQNTAENAQTLANTADATAKDANATASTAASNASAALSTAQSAAGKASDAASVATQAKATADSAAQSATDAAGVAQKASAAAANAAGIATGKADVLIQGTEPVSGMRKATTLWIDTTGGANTPKKWSGSAWVAVTDKTATDAANTAAIAKSAAQTAQSAADKAQTTADNAQAQANQAQAAALKAQTTADGKNLVYRGATEPMHDGLKPGDLWWKTQAFFTRWEGERDNSPSDLADFCTVWEGERDNSPSDLIPLSDHVIDILVWDGTRFNGLDISARDVLATGTVAAKHLAADSVTADKLAANAVTADKIAANAVTTAKLVADAVTADKLAANSVSARSIQSLAVVAGKLAVDSVNAGNIVSGAVTHRRGLPKLGIRRHRHQNQLDRTPDVGQPAQPDHLPRRGRKK